MKILLISPTQSGIGGIAQHVRGLTKFLQNECHEVDIISSENTFTIPIKGLKNPSFMISSSIKTKFMKKYDIVHAHNIPSAKAMDNAKGIKILSLHGIFSEQIDMLHGKTMEKISKKYETDALQFADIITAVSKDVQEHYSKLGYHVHHIPNAIDITSLPTNEKRMFEKQIVYVGRLSKEKGILELLTSIKELPKNMNLIIIGKGPEENIVKKASVRENIHYLGYLPHEQLIPIIRGSDILIQPSLIEGISTSILEAMACKTAIIATNVGGNKELLENGKSAILIENHKEILPSIKQIFSDPSFQQLLIQNSFIEVQKYDWKNIGKKYFQLYSNLV